MEFFQAKEREVAACSGLGGGKSFVLMFSFICNEILAYPHALHCWASLSYQLLRDSAMPMFESFMDEMGIRYEVIKSERRYIINGKTNVIFRSLDAADKMRSVEIGSLYIDEIAYAEEYAVKTFLGRLRDKRGSLRFRTATTPKGFNFFYRYFVEQCNPNRKIVQMSTYENKHLPQEYIDLLESSYDSEMQRQELNGEFLSVGSNRTYYKFDRQKHVVDMWEPKDYPLLSVGMDFNINPMTAVVGYVNNDKIYIVSEAYLKNSNTHKMRDHLLHAYGENLFIVPDATGSARKTNSTRTDHDILRECFEVARVRNPHRKDRFNCVNNLLDKGRLFIHTSCQWLIKDLERFCDDGKDETLGHISDALGYLCWYYFPLKKNFADYKSDERQVAATIL